MGPLMATSKTKPVANRRTAVRRDVLESHIITVDFPFQSGALLLDLSETGMGVQAVASPLVGTDSPWSLQMPGTSDVLRGGGKVAWSDRAGRFGVRLEQVEPAVRAQVRDWVVSQQGNEPEFAPALVVPSPPFLPPREADAAVVRRELERQRLGGHGALQFLIERICEELHACGAAIAFEKDDAIVCRASTGQAPEPGAAVNPNSGLTGECIRSGRVVRCEDTETDPRVDRMVCRALELRSAVIVPILDANRVCGVVEAFSSTAHAFRPDDVSLLRTVAEIVREVIAVAPAPLPHIPERQQEAPPVPRQPEKRTAPAAEGELRSTTPTPSRADAPVPAVARPPAPQARVELKDSATRPDRADRPAKTGPANAPPVSAAASNVSARPVAKAAAATATGARVADPAVVEPVVERKGPSPARAARLAEAPTAPAAIATDEHQPAPLGTASGGRLSDAEYLPDLVPQLPENRGLVPRIALLFLLVAILTVVGWRLWPKAAPPQAAAAARPVAAQPATPISTPAPPAASVSAPVPAKHTTTEPPRAMAKNTGASDAVDPDVTWTQTQPAAPLELRQSSRVVEAPNDPPPMMPIASDKRSGAISSVLETPIPAPSLAPTRTASVPVSAGLTGGKLKVRIEPLYPAAARALNLSGSVVLKATVGQSGRVSNVKVVSGNAVLAAAATDAIRRWVYEPFKLNGQAIEMQTTITVNFGPLR